ncbi:MAG: hypothetical protein HY394_02560 [Candidatus Diapherotrites archaeon]|nr:hypothetical protein [Candidatus Diapherotrites archaeon]
MLSDENRAIEIANSVVTGKRNMSDCTDEEVELVVRFAYKLTDSRAEPFKAEDNKRKFWHSLERQDRNIAATKSMVEETKQIAESAKKLADKAEENSKIANFSLNISKVVAVITLAALLVGAYFNASFLNENKKTVEEMSNQTRLLATTLDRTPHIIPYLQTSFGDEKTDLFFSASEIAKFETDENGNYKQISGGWLKLKLQNLGITDTGIITMLANEKDSNGVNSIFWPQILESTIQNLSGLESTKRDMKISFNACSERPDGAHKQKCNPENVPVGLHKLNVSLYCENCTEQSYPLEKEVTFCIWRESSAECEKLLN